MQSSFESHQTKGKKCKIFCCLTHRPQFEGKVQTMGVFIVALPTILVRERSGREYGVFAPPSFYRGPVCVKIMASKGKGIADPIHWRGLNGDREPWQLGDAGIPVRPATCSYIAIAGKVHQLDIGRPENGTLVYN